MPVVRTVRTNFTGGYIGPDLHGRSNFQLYEDGLADVQNLRIMPQGGVRRRPGTRRAQTLTSRAYQHEVYIFNSEQAYNFLFYDTGLIITDEDGITVQTLTAAPWTAAMLGELSFEYAGDFSFVTHGDMPMQVIQRTGATTFTRSEYEFEEYLNGSVQPRHQPYYRYAAADISLKLVWVSYSGGGAYAPTRGLEAGATVTLTTSASYFTADHVGLFLRVGDGQIKITAYTNATTATAVVVSRDIRIPIAANAMQTFEGSSSMVIFDPFHAYIVTDVLTILMAEAFRNIPNTSINGTRTLNQVTANSWGFDSGTVADKTAFGGGAAAFYWGATVQTRDWAEPLFSNVHGYARTVGFHQQRLIFGGSRDLPNRLVMSRVEAPYNFDVGTGLDDESIQVDVRMKKVPAITHILSGTHLNVFTTEGEFYAPFGLGKKPLTPSEIAIIEQTSYGTGLACKPCAFDGAAAFVTRSGTSLREFVFEGDDVGYSSPNISFQAQELLRNPVQMDSLIENADQQEATVYMCNDDGSMAVLAFVRKEKIAAWGLWTTDGSFKSIRTVDRRLFTIVERTIAGVTTTFLEYFDVDALLDASVSLTNPTATVTWTGLTQFAGQTVHVVDDGAGYLGSFAVSAGGVLTLDQACTDIEVGLYFMPLIKTLPPEVALEDGPTIGEPRHVASVTMMLKDTVTVSVGNQSLAIRSVSEDVEDIPAVYTGLATFNMLGWDTSGQITITWPEPLPSTLLALSLRVEF